MDDSQFSKYISKFSGKLSSVVSYGRNKVGKINSKVYEHEQTVSYMLVSIALAISLGIRLQPLYFDDLEFPPDMIIFASDSGYETYRGLMYVVKNYPIPLLSDTLSNYPTVGASQATGSVLDTIIGLFVLPLTAVLSQSEATLIVTYLIGPVSILLIGLLLYKIVSGVFDQSVGVVSLLILMLLPGQLLQSTMIGSGSRVPLHLLTFLGIVYATITVVQKAQEEVFVLESITDDLLSVNTFSSFVLILSLLGILFVLIDPLYVFVYFGLLGLLNLQYGSISARKEHTVIESVPLSLFIPLLAGTFGVSLGYIALSYSLVHIGVSLLVLLGSSALVVSNRTDVALQPSQIVWSTTAVVLIGAVGLVYQFGDTSAIERIVEPSQTNLFTDNAPLTSVDVETLLRENFGLFGFGSIFGYAILHISSLYNSAVGKVRSDRFVISSLGVVLIGLTIVSPDLLLFTSIGIALFGSYLIFFVSYKTELFKLQSVDIKAYHVLAVVAIFGLFVPTLLFPVDGTAVAQGQTQDMSEPSWVSASEELDSIADTSIDPYGSPMEQPSSGVVMWPQHGTEQVQSISGLPTTGTEVQSRMFTSEYLLSQSEDEAERVENEYGAQSEYIVLDWRSTTMQAEMRGMVETHPEYQTSQFYTPVFDSQTRRIAFSVNTDKYYKSLGVRLYYYHGSRVTQQPVTATYTTRDIGSTTANTTFLPLDLESENHIRRFESMNKAQQYVDGKLEVEDSGGNGESGIPQPRDSSTEGPTSTEQPTTDQSSEEQTTESTESTESTQTQTPPESESSQEQTYEGTRQIGGIGVHPTTTVSSLHHYRYVSSSSQSLIDDDIFNQYAGITSQYTSELRYSDLLREDGQTKVFQNVEGAKIQGSGGPSERQVQIVISLENEQTGTPVRYIQTVQTDSEGNFETTVPYASEGNPEEYTVQPTQNYQMLSQVSRLAQSESGEGLRLERTYWYSDEVIVSNEDVTQGDTVKVTLKEMNREELTEAAKGDGIIRPQGGSQSSQNNSGESDN